MKKWEENRRKKVNNVLLIRRKTLHSNLDSDSSLLLLHLISVGTGAAHSLVI